MEFEITAPDGRTLSIEGDSMPNEQELEEIFANVKSDFNSGKAKTSDIYSVDGLPSDTPSKLMQVGEFLKEGVAKPVAQGYFNIAKGFGGMMNWYADQSRLSKEDAEALDISEDVRQKLNTFSDILNIAGDSVRFGSEEWLEKEWLKSDPEVFKGEFFENPSWTRASAAVASALPSFTSIVAFGKSNFALGYALMAGSENADIYLEAKEKIGEEKASGLFLAGTTGTAAIDVAMKPIEKIIKPLKGGFIKRMAERAIRGGMEALPESLQQVYQNAVKKYGYDATQSLWSGVIESAIGGFGMGAVAAGAEGLIEQGATEEEVEQLQNVAVESIVANSKELNDIAYQDMKKTLTKINEKFANMSEDDVMRIGRELEEGFGKYYRELSEIMPEEQARSNAALIRNHAFFASDAMGISPKEYFDKYAPKIEKTAFSEFEKPKQEAKPYVLSEEELKGVEAPQMTQQDINYAKSHPELKKNANNIELIERAGASINDDLETINNALRNYAAEDYRYRREQEVNRYNILANKLTEDEQAPRGAFANDTIYLFENANESSLPHELTHSWQKELRRISATNPTEKLTGMLEQIDNWTSSEFTRKYNVSKRNYGYAVVDKRGNVVYDNRGNGFLTEQDAVEYAKDEIFARGFEQYVREGKAPNNSLKQAFRNFFMWLKKIYRDAMDLNIQLSPDIKNVYADLLGGVDVDFFLDATPESFIQQRIKLGEQREKTLDGIIKDAQANKQRVVKTKRGKGFSRVWATAMIPLSTRAKRISPKLRNVLRKYEFTLSSELNKKYDKVKPFMDLWKNMSEDDIIAFDFALKNDYVAKQLEIVDKYNSRKEWEAVRETLENIYDEALNAGLDINWRPDYFPRKVKDVDGFLSYLHNAPEWTRFQQAISEAGLDGATAEEQAEFLNKYLRGFVKVDLMPNKYGSEKERKIDIIDNEMNQFYAPSIEALVGYIEGLNSRIVSSKFLGKGDNIEESIGGYLTYLLNNNIIAPEQIDEARNILRARFDARGVSNPWLANMRNYSYMYTMGGINSAITQIEDLSVSMYKAGVWNTLTTAMKSKRITKKDLGLDSISAEFVEQSKSASYLNKLFKLTGLDGIDSFGKETLVNAELKKLQKMSDETLREYLEPIMEEETNATIQDIRNDTISDNVLYLMFSELSDVQPISLSELPEFYNRGGNLRILYMLKSFALKRIDIFRNECIDKIKSKDFNQVKEGMQNLLKLSALMVICGSSKDWLIDLLYGRETDMSERVLNNILGLVGLSKFQIYQAKEKGFTGTVKDIVVPPLFAVFDDLFTDVAKGVQGKRKIKDFEVWKGIPLVGRFYYWWVGRGSEKQKKNKKY